MIRQQAEKRPRPTIQETIRKRELARKREAIQKKREAIQAELASQPSFQRAGLDFQHAQHAQYAQQSQQMPLSMANSVPQVPQISPDEYDLAGISINELMPTDEDHEAENEETKQNIETIMLLLESNGKKLDITSGRALQISAKEVTKFVASTLKRAETTADCDNSSQIRDQRLSNLEKTCIAKFSEVGAAVKEIGTSVKEISGTFGSTGDQLLFDPTTLSSS
ncbi:hypothetical protein B0T10DRAFT_580714 [Thelonectria olida]|uniref:Uncharacterized protein n=1 Tax=Thelonectria olida TaxID=1576542 RepID=A0A9P9AIB3_9HYPO|nr:hypothetical protein B0T10DRAFT_580714 [Thelonectria olida]